MLVNPYTGDLAALAELLADVEALHHSRGWDNNSTTLYAVTRSAGAYQFTGWMGYDLSATTSEPAAHLLLTEAWLREFSGRAERDAETRRYADIPGSVECRDALAVAGDQVIRLRRIRNRIPEFIPDCGPLGEAMVMSLCAIHRGSVDLYRVPAITGGL